MFVFVGAPVAFMFTQALVTLQLLMRRHRIGLTCRRFARFGDMIAETIERVGSICMLAVLSEFSGKLLGTVMNHQDVNLVVAHKPVDDSVRASHDLADLRVFELADDST